MAIGSDKFWTDAIRAHCEDKTRNPKAWLANDYSHELWLRILQQHPKQTEGKPTMTECSICKPGTCEGYFGLCPVCHDTAGYINVGCAHVFYCREHKKKWCVGSNLFSSWRWETEEAQRQQYDEIGLGGFESIAPHHPPECIAFRRDGHQTPSRLEAKASGADGDMDEILF
jgi:hypothetical protein